MTDENATPEAQTQVQDAVPAENVEDSNPTHSPASEENKPTDDTDTGDQPDASKEQKQPLSDVDKVKHATQKRIDALVAKNAEMERLLQEARTRMGNKQPTQGGELQEPKESDFDSYEEYLIAKGRFEAKQEHAKEQQEAETAKKAAEQAADIAKRKAAFEQKEAELRKVHKDYDEASQVVNETIASLTERQKSSMEFQVFRDMMFSSDDMASLAYHLGKNPDVLYSLLEKSPVQIVREIAKIEMGLVAAPKPEPKTPPADPPRPMDSKSKPGKSPAEMSPDALMKWVNS